MSTAAHADLPLAGIRVVDLTLLMPGKMATRHHDRRGWAQSHWSQGLLVGADASME